MYTNCDTSNSFITVILPMRTVFGEASHLLFATLFMNAPSNSVAEIFQHPM